MHSIAENLNQELVSVVPTFMYRNDMAGAKPEKWPHPLLQKPGAASCVKKDGEH